MARKPPGPQAVATNRLEELVIVDREPGGTGSGVVRPMPPGGCRPGVHRILTRGGVVTVERGVSRRLAAQGVRQAAELGAELFAEA